MASIEPVLVTEIQYRRGLTSLDFHPLSTHIAVGCTDNTVVVFGVKSKNRTSVLTGHQDSVLDVAFNKTGSLIASGSKDTSLRVFSRPFGTVGHQYNCHQQHVRSVEFSHDSELVLTASNDKIVRLISVSGRKNATTFKGHAHWVNCARFSADNRNIVSGSEDGIVKLWDARIRDCVQSYNQRNHVTSVAFHPYGTTIGSSDVSGQIYMWDIRIHKLIQVHDTQMGSSVNSIDYHKNGRLFVSGSTNGTLVISDLDRGRAIYTLDDYSKVFGAVRFDKRGNLIAAVGSNRKVRVYNVEFKNEEAKKVFKLQAKTPVTSSKSLASIPKKDKKESDERESSLEWFEWKTTFENLLRDKGKENDKNESNVAENAQNVGENSQNIEGKEQNEFETYDNPVTDSSNVCKECGKDRTSMSPDNPSETGPRFETACRFGVLGTPSMEDFGSKYREEYRNFVGDGSKLTRVVNSVHIFSDEMDKFILKTSAQRSNLIALTSLISAIGKKSIENVPDVFYEKTAAAIESDVEQCQKLLQEINYDCFMDMAEEWKDFEIYFKQFLDFLKK